MPGVADFVAYLGPEGTFCEQAATRYFPESTTRLLTCPSIRGVFEAVKEDRARFGVVPLENSLQGSERATLDLLLENDLKVCGEIDLRVVHNLVVRPGMKMDDVRLVMSHPLALAQCHFFLEGLSPNLELKETSSTARAVEQLRSIEKAAAIGTEIAAERYGMVVLFRGIEDDPNNYTRFFVLGKSDGTPTGRDKTSIVFSVDDEPGALYRVLEVFALRRINLTKVESRPERGKPWRYIFYLDFEGHRAEGRVADTLVEVAGRCIFVKTLGSYPRSSDILASTG